MSDLIRIMESSIFDLTVLELVIVFVIVYWVVK